MSGMKCRVLQLIWILSLYLSSSQCGHREDTTRKLIDVMLRNHKSERLKNSVLERLERTLQQDMITQQRQQDEDCGDPSESLPEYTEFLQESNERDTRQLGAQKHYPICHLRRKIRRLNTEEYEYRPAYFEEIRCEQSYQEEGSNEICSSLGFSCVQWNKTIHLTRRKYTSDCWETRTIVIPAGCECMWPVHKLGEMNAHEYGASPANSDD